MSETQVMREMMRADIEGLQQILDRTRNADDPKEVYAMLVEHKRRMAEFKVENEGDTE